MIAISELQRDALGEIFNIGVGRAAASLSVIVRDEVMLSAPTVILCSPEEATQALERGDFRKFSAVTQDFSGPFIAQAMLVFPEQNALEIVSLMMGSTNLTAEELSEYEQEAMCEVGNIILNSCMSALADLFAVQIESTLPVHRFGDAGTVMVFGGSDHHVVLLLQVDLHIRQQCIHGQIVFLLSVSSLSTLIELVDDYLVKMGLG